MKTFKLMAIAAWTLLLCVSACKQAEDKTPDDEGVKITGTFTRSALVDAISGMYSEWEGTTTIPQNLTIGGKVLSFSEYVWAEAELLKSLVSGNTSDIIVKNPKTATKPNLDSYDAESIKIKDGGKDGKGQAEDLFNIANRIIEEAKVKGQLRNQIIFYRGSEAIAFSLNRAVVTMARAISIFKSKGSLPEMVSTEYLSASATLKGFAEQFVTYLDVWENTIGTVSADGSHCSDNNTAWENVHFIPIPYSGGYYDGKDQYDPKYQPYHTISVGGVTYTSNQCWQIALKGILDLITKEGSALKQTQRNVTVHTLGNGSSLNQAIPTFDEWAVWGKYPWYEKADDPGVIKKGDKELQTANLEFLLKLIPWHLTRSSQLGAIGNYQLFGTDPAGSLVLPPYSGNISPMRELLIAARFYKYLLDKNITQNVYDAMKDVEISADLYGRSPEKISISKSELSFTYEAGSQTIKVDALEAWSSAKTVDWITVNPASGASGESQDVVISVSANEDNIREGTVTFSAGGFDAVVKITQTAPPSSASIRDFIKEYIKILDIWSTTQGTINYLTGEAPGEAVHDNPNAHYVPEATNITVGGRVYNTADMLETAERAYLLLRGYDGNWTGGYGANAYNDHKLSGSTIDTKVPKTNGYKWGASPYNETGSTSPGNVVTGNGGNLKMGDPNTADGVDLVKLDILDNFAFRHTNWPVYKGAISNMCGYSSGQLAGYYGCFSAKRALLTYAWFFKYLMDNNLNDAVSISADQTFRTDLFGTP